MLIIAHRGASVLAPENTLAAFRIAWEQRADAIECDIHLSRDGRIAVLHDNSTLRTTGVDHAVAECSWDELSELDAGSWHGEEYAGERIPLLQQVLDAAPEGGLIVIELKTGPEILPPLAGLLAEYRDKLRFVIISFKRESLVAARKALPEIPAMLLAHLKPDPATGELIGYREAIGVAGEIGVPAVGLHYLGLDPWVVELAREKGIRVYSWTVDDPETALRLRELGVEGVTTNQPELIRNALSGQQQR